MRSARVVSSVIRTTLGWDGARDLNGAEAVVCAQHDKDTIHGNALLAKRMTGGQFTSRNNDEFTFCSTSRFFRLDYRFLCGVCFRQFLWVCNRFHSCRCQGTPIVGLGDLQ